MDMTLTFDPAEEGLAKVLNDYQIEALKLVWEKGEEGATSNEVCQHVNEVLKGIKTVSRASIINFLNAMVDEGVLSYKEESGKGGYHRVYSPKLTERGFKKHIARMVISSLIKDFPEETNETLSELILI
jgi:predicted transcriptional regulator